MYIAVVRGVARALAGGQSAHALMNQNTRLCARRMCVCMRARARAKDAHTACTRACGGQAQCAQSYACAHIERHSARYLKRFYMHPYNDCISIVSVCLPVSLYSIYYDDACIMMHVAA